MTFQPLSRLTEHLRKKRPEVHRHGAYVARLCLAVAVELQLADSDASLLARAAAVHDLGKVGVPVEVLEKPAALDDTERTIMRAHASLGSYLLRRSYADGVDVERLARIVGQHHERVDGTGYPHALPREQLDPLTLVLTVVDAFAAMVEDRPYQGSVETEAALAELEASAGTQFDERCVAAFVAIARREPQLLVA